MNAIQEALNTAGRLLDAGDDASRREACDLLTRTLAEQVTDTSSPAFGQFPKDYGGGTGDYNMSLFYLPRLVALREQHAAALPPPLAVQLDGSIRLALDAAFRRWDDERFDLIRDHKAYSNIFLLYIQAFFLGGHALDDARLRRIGAAQWQRWFNHIAYYGIDEFVSDYYDVDFEALSRIRSLAPDPAVRQQAERVLDHLATLQHAVTHPRLKLAVCGASRSYRTFVTGGAQEAKSIAAGAAPADDRSDRSDQSDRSDRCDAPYRPPRAVVAAYRNRAFPYSISGRAGIAPFRFQSWQGERAALGSMTGGNYFWQQIHCMAAVGESADAREVLFIPGAYTIANGYVSQRDNRALCLFSRRPNTYLRTQKVVDPAGLADAFGDSGIGVTAGWRIAEEAGRMTFTAHGHRVVIDSFVLDGETILPAALRKIHRNSLSQGRFHRTPIDMDEYVFPADAEWFGCLVQIVPEAQPPLPRPAISCKRLADTLTLDEQNELKIDLHLNPAGGDIELYETDWRTLPLLACPEQTLNPGEMLGRT